MESEATIFAGMETRGMARGREGNLITQEMRKREASGRGDACSHKQRDSAREVTLLGGEDQPAELDMALGLSWAGRGEL